MVKSAIKTKLAKIVERIKTKYRPEKIILFGSYAYGKPKKNSDIDLFIVKETEKRRIDRFCEVRKIIRDIKGTSVQPIVFTRVEIKKRLKIGDDFVKEILANGQTLYG